MRDRAGKQAGQRGKRGGEDLIPVICCIIGTALLVLSIILCIVSDNNVLWLTVLLIGEIVAFFGYMPVFLKFF